MRALALAALACAALAAGCSNPCQELGDRLCDCRDPGTTKASCVYGVRTEVERLHPGTNSTHACSKALDECHAPADTLFCDWLQGRCGKAACGMSEEDIGTLETKQVDPNCVPVPPVTCAPGDTSCTPSSGVPCPKICTK